MILLFQIKPIFPKPNFILFFKLLISGILAGCQSCDLSCCWRLLHARRFWWTAWPCYLQFPLCPVILALTKSCHTTKIKETCQLSEFQEYYCIRGLMAYVVVIGHYWDSVPIYQANNRLFWCLTRNQQGRNNVQVQVWRFGEVRLGL